MISVYEWWRDTIDGKKRYCWHKREIGRGTQDGVISVGIPKPTQADCMTGIKRDRNSAVRDATVVHLEEPPKIIKRKHSYRPTEKS